MWFLRIFFYQLYHAFAWSYDLVAAVVSGGRWQQWVVSVIPLIHGKTVLELGAGTGHLQAALTASGFESIGVDESRQMLRIANDKMAGKNLEKRLIRARAEALPLAANSFDTIVATFPSEYILQPETLHACRRVLRPGGRFVILIGVQIGGKGIANRLLRILYHVTGQGTPDLAVLEKILDRLSKYGYKANLEQLVYQQDTLTILVAT